MKQKRPFVVFLLTQRQSRAAASVAETPADGECCSQRLIDQVKRREDDKDLNAIESRYQAQLEKINEIIGYLEEKEIPVISILNDKDLNSAYEEIVRRIK